MLSFVKLKETEIPDMSKMAKEIVKEHFDPIIGPEQNNFMISLFQTEEAIRGQLEQGYNYFFVREDDINIGFFAYYFKKDVFYLSKFYLYKNQRGKGYSSLMLKEIEKLAKENGYKVIELNVNRNNSACRVYEHLGFRIEHEEKNDIGHGYIMDDYVYRKVLD